MIAPQFYFIGFAIFVGLLIFLKISSGTFLHSDFKSNRMTPIWLISILLILFFGLRPLGTYYMGDTGAYNAQFELIQQGVMDPDLEVINEEDSSINYNGEIGFAIIRNFFANNDFNVRIWFIIVAIIYIVPVVYAIKRLFPGFEYLAFLFFISSFGFYSYGINGIRNGDAMSLFFLGFAIIATSRSKPWMGVLWCIIAYSFHHSVIISIVALLASLLFIKNTKNAIIIWIICIFISLLSGSYLAEFATSFSPDDRLQSYVENGQDEKMMAEGFTHVGFRWDFLVFSFMPILLGWYVTIKKRIYDYKYQLLLNTYIIANAIWIIFMYSSFTNRFAALSWSLYPFVLCYPLVKFKFWGEHQNLKASLILLAQFIFVIIFH